MGIEFNSPNFFPQEENRPEEKKFDAYSSDEDSHDRMLLNARRIPVFDDPSIVMPPPTIFKRRKPKIDDPESRPYEGDSPTSQLMQGNQKLNCNIRSTADYWTEMQNIENQGLINFDVA